MFASIDLQPLMWVAGLLTIIAAPIAWVWRDNRGSIKEAHQRVDALHREVGEYKLEAARSFVTNEMVVRLEKRLIASEERMAAGFEKLGDRIDRSITHLISSQPR